MPTQPNQPTSFDASLLVFSLCVLACLFTCLIMWLMGNTPPDALVAFSFGLVGTFMGARLPQSGVQQMSKSIQHITQALE